MRIGRYVSERRDGPHVSINCPECEAEAVTAESWHESGRFMLLDLIPLRNTEHVFLRCPACRRKLYTFIELDELQNYDPEEIEEYLAMYKPLIGTVVAIYALVNCSLPLYGLICSGIAMIVNRQRDDWVETVSKISLVLSIVATALGLLIMAIKIIKWLT